MRTVATLTLVGLLMGSHAGHRFAAVGVAAAPTFTMSPLTDRDMEKMLQAFADWLDEAQESGGK